MKRDVYSLFDEVFIWWSFHFVKRNFQLETRQCQYTFYNDELAQLRFGFWYNDDSTPHVVSGIITMLNKSFRGLLLLWPVKTPIFLHT